MKPSHTTRFGMAAAIVLLSAACASTSSSGSASPSNSSAVESVGSLSTEPVTGTESAKPPSDGSPSLSLAPAPTGSQDAVGPNSACITIRWLGNPIPPGDIVTITSATARDPFRFDPAVTATCDTPSCINYQFSAANYNGPSCYVGLSYSAGSIVDNGNYTVGNMVLAGILRCSANVSFTACQHHAVALGKGTSSFNVHTIDNTSPPTSPPPQSTSSSPSNTSSPAATSSSSPAAAAASP